MIVEAKRVDKDVSQAVNRRLASFVFNLTDRKLGVTSKRNFSETIGIDRSNLYNVLKGNWNFTGSQVVLLFKLLEDRGLLKGALDQILGTGETCILNTSASQSLRRSSRISHLVKKHKAQRS